MSIANRLATSFLFIIVISLLSQKINADTTNINDLAIDSTATTDTIEITRMNHALDDSVADKHKWWTALKHGKIDFNDTSMGYPRFLLFCKDVYYWGDRVFNSYNPEYVEPTGKNWKLIFQSNQWFDSFSGRPFPTTVINLRSDMTSNIGVQLSFMAVSLGYTFDINKIIGGGANTSKKLNFSFTCARFSIDAFTMENSGPMTITRFGNFVGERFTRDFRGLSRSSAGANFIFYFNNRRYAQAAAYCFSKYQRRSAGTFLVGANLFKYDVIFDTDEFPPSMNDFLAAKGITDNSRFRTNDYCLSAGYAHNYVLAHNWLVNLTAMPYLGLKRTLDFSIEKKKYLLSTNFRLRACAVYNHRQFFGGIQATFDGHLYHSSTINFFNSITDFNLTTGVRF